jgi:predicted DsbA family dithiol-disulfide isomerase
MKIKVYSDTICGWCYIGHKRLQNALDQFKNISFEIVHCPFQLNPDMPLSGMPRSQYLDIKFGGFNNAKPMYDNMVAQATSESLKINFDIVKQTPNTLKSHFLILYAQQFQKTSEVLTAIFNSYFTLGQDIGDEAILTAIANNYFDFDPKLFQDNQYSNLIAEIKKSDQIARSMGINGVPFFEINNKAYISGAQSTSNLVEAITNNQ